MKSPAGPLLGGGRRNREWGAYPSPHSNPERHAASRALTSESLS